MGFKHYNTKENAQIFYNIYCDFFKEKIMTAILFVTLLQNKAGYIFNDIDDFQDLHLEFAQICITLNKTEEAKLALQSASADGTNYHLTAEKLLRKLTELQKK